MANEAKQTRVSAKQKLTNRREVLKKITLGEVFNDEELNDLIKKSNSLNVEEKEVLKLGVKALLANKVKLVSRKTYDIV